MHPINGLQLDEYAKQHYEHVVSAAQRDLYAEAIAKGQRGQRLDWLRSLLTNWRRSSSADIERAQHKNAQ